MRRPFDPQLRFDCPGIPDVRLNTECRDELIPILRALQHIYARPDLRAELLDAVAHDVNGTPLGLLIALRLLALPALAVLLALLARQFGWGEERLAGARHAWGEAAYRASGTWADFVDWIRPGRGPQQL